MKIRQETLADFEAIEDLTYQAFENHPHHEPGAKPTEHLIVNKLREAEVLSLSLVAEDNSGIVGHIAFSPVSIDGENCPWFGLGPVSVKPSRQGEGIGGELIRKGISMLEKQGAMGIVLLGEPEYYGRFGFKVDRRLILSGVPVEYFLALSLVDSSENSLEGEVTYHSSFN